MADQRQQPPVHAEADLTESLETTSALPAPSSRADAIAHIAPPSSPPARRPHFSSFQSDTTAVEQSIPLIEEEDEEEEHVADTVHRQTPSGLGIDASTTPQTARRVSMQPVSRKFTSSTAKSPSIKSTPVFSPPTSAGPFFTTFPQSSAENTPDLRRERSSPDIGTFEQFRQGVLKNRSNTSINDYENFLHTSDSERLRGAPSVRSAYENDFHPSHECPTAKDFYQSRFTWLNMSIMVICLFSCVFSGIFLGLAIQAPHYGRKISSQGSFKPKDAILLTSIMAKLIEISFVTGFVSFLGQVLSRRAFMKDDGRGVTLSELSMWRWVVQPGTLITHWETAKYAGLTLLGILSLLSALLATLYSSAAVALVQPVLRDGYWDEGLVLAGNVKSDFANVVHVKNLCKTPIKNDKEEQGSTCLQIEHAGQGFHNFHRWLAGWDGIQAFGNGTDDLSGRPQGFGLLYENTTVTAQWIEVTNTTTRSAELGRVINNVSLAMPHSGVFAAARDQRNGIMQPEELDSEGTYSLVASVPSPVMHALCVNMNKDELAPIIFNTWPGRESLNVSDWDNAKANATTTNKTVVDDIFGWNDGQDINLPPVFPKYPMPFNTIMNHTSFKWGRSAIYMLGQGGKMDNADTTGTYALCKLSVTINSNCSTRYNVTGSGGTMEALCEERAGRMAFKNSDPAAPSSIDVPNWRDIGFDWSNALQLNTGIVDAKASNARLLTQLILQPASTDPLQVTLNKALPSLSEALAVLSGCTLLKAMLDAPFVMSWNYTSPMLEQYQTQFFNATLKAQQYASGGADRSFSTKGWIIVLALVFAMNVFVFVYFICHRGFVTDFSEPPNLFALAVNSPPSQVLAGSCGGGPEGQQYMSNWFVNHEGSHLFMEPGEKSHLLSKHGSPHVHSHGEVQPLEAGQSKGGFFANAVGDIKRRLGMKESAPTKTRQASAVESLRPSSIRPLSVASEYELEEGQTRMKRNYERLAKRRSRL